MIIYTIKVASNLTSAEKKLDYEAEATEYVPSHIDSRRRVSGRR